MSKINLEMKNKKLIADIMNPKTSNIYRKQIIRLRFDSAGIECGNKSFYYKYLIPYGIGF